MNKPRPTDAVSSHFSGVGRCLSLFLLLFFVTACQPQTLITSFEQCVEAGNPVMESYPRQCAAKGQTFVEEIEAEQEQQFVVCKETVTGFSAEDFAKENSGICVDMCPEGYDPYVTQIGVELCIVHYGLQEINQWPTCERSSDSCDCVKAYETTSDEPISNAQYRCVPDRYAQRLLFRAGIDRLDENGQNSVVIA